MKNKDNSIISTSQGEKVEGWGTFSRIFLKNSGYNQISIRNNNYQFFFNFIMHKLLSELNHYSIDEHKHNFKFVEQNRQIKICNTEDYRG